MRRFSFPICGPQGTLGSSSRALSLHHRCTRLFSHPSSIGSAHRSSRFDIATHVSFRRGFLTNRPYGVSRLMCVPLVDLKSHLVAPVGSSSLSFRAVVGRTKNDIQSDSMKSLEESDVLKQYHFLLELGLAVVGVLLAGLIPTFVIKTVKSYWALRAGSLAITAITAVGLATAYALSKLKHFMNSMTFFMENFSKPFDEVPESLQKLTAESIEMLEESASVKRVLGGAPAISPENPPRTMGYFPEAYYEVQYDVMVEATGFKGRVCLFFAFDDEEGEWSMVEFEVYPEATEDILSRGECTIAQLMHLGALVDRTATSNELRNLYMDDWYVVDSIIDERAAQDGSGDELEYLVRWEDGNTTWVPETEIPNDAPYLAQWFAQRK